LLDSVREGRDEEVKSAEEEYSEKIIVARRKKAELLLFYKDEMNNVVDRIRSANQAMNEAATMANAPEYKVRNEYPTPNFTDTYSGTDKPLAPTMHDIINAYHHGKIAPWIQWFAISGEIVFSDEEALKCLREKGEQNE
jgi:hypothetical protein